MVGVMKAKPRLSYATLASTLVGIVLISGCVREGAALVYQTKPSPEEHIPPASAVKKESEAGMTGRDTFDKMTLWTKETQLRGTNIYQVQIYSDIHGSEFMGPGPVGPPYTEDDFSRLASLGANLVIVSHPGLYEVKPPYKLNKGIQDNLDKLLDMIAKADMFAVCLLAKRVARHLV